MASTIYLVQQGESKANVELMNLPNGDDLITENGLLQASLLGKKFKEENIVFTKAYSSTFSRALETVQVVFANMDAAKLPTLNEDERLRERGTGIYENRPLRDLFKDIVAAAEENNVNMLDFEVEGGERLADLEARISAFWEDLIQDCRQNEKPQTILIVTHGIIIMQMMLKLCAWAKQQEKNLTLKNCELLTVTIPVENTGYHVFTIEGSKNETKTVIEFTKLHQKDHLAVLPKAAPNHNPDLEFYEIAAKFHKMALTQCTTQ